MASNDTLYMTLELKDNLSKQIEEDTKRTESLNSLIKELNKNLKEIGEDKMAKNVSKNLKDAEKALYKLLEAKEKVDKALSRNMSMRQDGFLGMNESDLLKMSARLDDIIDKIMNVGVRANYSSSAVKDMLASLSSDVTIKSASSLASATNKELDKQVKDRTKANNEAAKEWVKAENDAATAAANNAKNQDRVRDALARIATARANLSAANERGSQQEQAHVQLLMSLLDRLSSRLNTLKNQFLGESGALEGVLGSGFKGLMRNVNTTIKDIGNVTGSIQQKPVSLISEQDVSDTISRVDAIGAAFMRLQKLLTEMNNWRDSPRSAMQMALSGNWNKYSGNYEQQMSVFRDTLQRIKKEIEDMSKAGINISEPKRQLDALFETFVKLEALKPVDLASKLGLEHLRGYTGPQQSLTDEAWKAAKREAEIREVATQAAERHRQKLEELSAAFQKLSSFEKAEQAAANRAQQRQANIQARKDAAKATREQAESLIKLRQELLKTQAMEIRNIMRNGQGVLNPQELEAARAALRSITNEMITLNGVMSSTKGYSTWSLFEFGRGSQNHAPLIAHAQQAIEASRSVQVLTESERRFVESLSQASSSLRDHGVLLRDLQMMATQYLSLWGARSFLNNIIETGGLLEQQRLSIGAILGSMDKAEVIFGKIKDLAVKSPFGVVQLDTMSKQLTAYGFQYEELFDWTKRLADISAATGTEVSRLALALGHVRSEGALSGYTLRQFAMANVPLLQNLATNLGITTKEVRERTKKKEIGYDEVKKVLQDLTDEGGMFYNAQEVMSEALNAKFKNLRDAFDIMYGEIAESGVGSVLKSIAETLTAGAKEWQRFGTDLLWVASAFGIVKTAMLAHTQGMKMLSKEMGILSYNTRAYTAAQVDELAKSGALTREQLLRAVATGRLSVEQARLAATTLNVSEATLQQAAATGTVTKAMLGNAMATSRFSVAQLRLLATMRAQGTMFPLLRLQIMGVTSALQAAGAAFRKFLPFLAIGAVVDFFMRWKQQSENAKQAAEEASSAMAANLDNIKQLQDSLGKNAPSGTEAMEQAVKDMTEALKEAGFYSDEFQRKVEGTDSVSGKYDLLLGKLREVSEEYNTLKARATAYMTAAMNVGGGLLSDNMEKDLGQMSQAFIKQETAKQNADKFADIYTKELVKQLKKKGKWVESEMAGMKWPELLGKMDNAGGFWGELKRTNSIFFGDEKQSEVERYNEAAIALRKYTEAVIAYNKAVAEVKAQTPEAGQNVLSAAASMIGKEGISDITRWNDSELTAFSNNINEVLSSANLDDKTKEKWRNMILDLIPDKEVREKLRNMLKVEPPKLEGWRADLQKYFDDHGINIKLSADDSIQSVEKKLQEARKKAQERMDSAGAILTYWKIKPDASAIEEFAKKHPFLAKIINAVFGDFTKPKKEVDAIDQAHKDLGLAVADPKKKNKKSGSGGKKEDTQLKKWKEEWSELKAFYSEYKKWAKEVGEDAALKKLRETGLWNQLFGADGNPVYDMRNWEKAIEQFEKRISGGTTDRDKFLFEVRKEKLSPQFDQAQDIVEAMLKRLDEELKKQGKEWNLYKKILDATGNRQMAAQMAFGEGISFKNQAEQLRKQIEDELLAAKLQDTVSVDELLGMDNKALKNIGIFEKSKILPMLKELKTVEQQLNAEEVELFLEVVKNANSLETELDKITLKYSRLRDAVDKNVNISDEQKAQMKTNLDAEEARAKAAKQWEWFKKNDAEWGRVFGNLDKMSTNTLVKMRDKLKEIAPSIREDVEAMKALYEAMAKLDKAINSRNPFEAMSEALSSSSILRNLLNGGINEYGFRNANGTYTIGPSNAAKLGLTPTQNGQYTEQQLRDALTGAEKDFAESVSGISKAFNEIQGVLHPVIDLFDALGNEGLSMFFKAGSNAIGSAASVAGSFNTLSTLFSSSSNKSLQELGSVLGKAGPYGAAAAAALSVLSSVLAMHDQALQREIDASQARQKEMENLTSKLEKALERAISGIYGFRTDEGALDRLDASLRYQSSGSIQDLIDYGKHGNSYRDYISEDTVKALDDAKKSRSYYDATYASLLAQRDELRHQYEMEDEKKKSDANRLNDYQNEIAEMDDQIKHFAEDMAKAIYGIDFKTWASELSETLVSAWSSGEDAAEAYRKKVSDILKDLGVKMITERFISKALEPIMEDFLKQYEQDEGVLTQDGMNILARMYDAGDTLVEQTNDFMDGLNSIARQHGADLEEAKESSSASSAIKGMTEQTADLLASYINAIRADVSVNRMTLQQILFAMQGQAEMPVIATAQLEQLRMIAQYTAATASNTARIDEIYSLLYENTLNANQFHVR